VKRILLSVLVCVLAACGSAKDGIKGKDGKDGQSAQGDAGTPGAAGEAGEDAVLGSVHCEYVLYYPNDKNPYIVNYSELAFAEGSTLATLLITYSGNGQQTARESALFSEGEAVVLNGSVWIATKDALIHKASKTKYIPKCK
jgi:hypothetical protein